MMDKERPILFSGEMVNAILQNRKFQTRRVIKPQPEWCNTFWWYDNMAYMSDDSMESHLFHNVYGEKGSPYGSLYGDGTTDTLWVREACRAEELPGGEDGVRYIADNAFVPIKNTSLAAERWCELNHYRGKRGAIVPPIHAPRWASRITLEVVNVKVERVNQISEKDALAEGIELVIQDQSPETRDYSRKDEWFQSWGNNESLGYTNYVPYDELARSSFRTLWDSINAKRGFPFDSGAWCWVIEFKRV